MKSCRLLAPVLLFFLLSSFRTGDGNNPFFAFLKQTGLKFVKPLNAVETKVIQNDELAYQYAIIDTVSKIEIRYLIYPLQEMEKAYNAPHPDTGIGRIDPDFLHTNFLYINTYKILGRELNVSEPMPDIREISHATVDKQYNADWGAEVSVEPCDEFAQKYKYCTLFAIHKDNVADAFIIFLYNNKDTFDEWVQPDLHTLVFTGQ